jgi:hypothetical protein
LFIYVYVHVHVHKNVQVHVHLPAVVQELVHVDVHEHHDRKIAMVEAWYGLVWLAGYVRGWKDVGGGYPPPPSRTFFACTGRVPL